MKVTQERLPESRVQLDIEIDQERVDKHLDEAFRKLAPRARVPGFRPGKAPRPLVERTIGRGRMMEEALDRLVPAVYNEAIEAEAIDAIDQPELSKVELDPVRLQFIVPIRPTVELGDYRALRVEAEPVEVSDEDVAEQVLALRRRHAIHVPVERGAQYNDILTATVRGTVDEETIIGDEDAEFALREDSALAIPGLASAFLGMARGDDKSIELPIPEDFRAERLRGKTAHIAIHVSEVKEEELPDEDEELAATVDAERFENFDQVREQIREDLATGRKNAEETRFRAAAIDALVAGARIEFPPSLVEHEIDHIIEGLSGGGDRSQYLTYLQRAGRSEAEYRETLREAAAMRVRRSLALTKLAEAEGLDADADEIEAEIEKFVEPLGEEAERLRTVLRTADGIATLRRNVTSQKTLERLLAIARGEAPPVPEGAPGEQSTPVSEAPAATAGAEPATPESREEEPEA